MKEYTTRDDLIGIRGQVGHTITRAEITGDLNVKDAILFLLKVAYATLNFLIRKTWGV